MRQCKVYVHDMEAGILQETDAREYVFTYGEDYHGEPVCLAMPVRKEAYHSNHLFPYFFKMLSEGSNHQVLENPERTDPSSHVSLTPLAIF